MGLTIVAAQYAASGVLTCMWNGFSLQPRQQISTPIKVIMSDIKQVWIPTSNLLQSY